jgi:hypothetical protein
VLGGHRNAHRNGSKGMSDANNTEQWEETKSDPLEGIKDRLDADALNNVCEKAQTKPKCDDL